MKQKRIHDIENYVNENDTVSLKELCKKFNVSMNTIRRDINYLEKSGVVKKVYGGVTATEGAELTTFDFRTTKNSNAKDIIARKAADQIENGDLIFIDSGTTTAPIIKNLDSELKVTVITNNLDVIVEASKNENIELIILGSRYHSKTRSFLNTDHQNDDLKFYNIKKAFMAATGISVKNGITNSDFNEYAVKNSIINRAALSYVLVDSTKIDKSGPLTYAELDDADTIITDKPIPETLSEYVKENSLSVIYSDK